MKRILFLLFVLSSCDKDMHGINRHKRPLVVVSTDKNVLWTEEKLITLKDGEGNIIQLPIAGFDSLQPGDTIK